MTTIAQRFLVLLIAVLCSAWPVQPVQARGGGGCVEQGAAVLTPAGPVPIERFKAGDVLEQENVGQEATQKQIDYQHKRV